VAGQRAFMRVGPLCGSACRFACICVEGGDEWTRGQGHGLRSGTLRAEHPQCQKNKQPGSCLAPSHRSELGFSLTRVQPHLRH
jgi:hypothetical protein